MIFLSPNDAVGQLNIVEVFVFFDFPRLFIAENAAEQRFVVNCVDSDEEQDEWLLSAVSERRLFALKDGALTLREVFTSPELGQVLRVVTRSTEVVSYEVLLPEAVPDADLPAANVLLKLTTATETPVQQDASVLARRLNSNIVLLYLFPNRTQHEAPAKGVGKVLASFQEYVSEKLTKAMRLPADIAEKTFQVNMVGTFAGSFGLEIAVRGDDPRISQTLKSAVRELGTLDDADVFEEQMSAAEDTEINVLKKFLLQLKDINSDLRIETASRIDTEPTTAEASLPRIRHAIKSLRREPKLKTIARTFVAELVGLNLRTRKFEVRDIQGEERITGIMAADIFDEIQKAELPSRYRVALEGDLRGVGDRERVASWRMISATKVRATK